MLFLFALTACDAPAASSNLDAIRQRVAARKSATAATVQAPSSSAIQASPAEAREMRDAEGAIVNIIDAYLDRKAPESVEHVFLGEVRVTCYWTADELDEGQGPKNVPITIKAQDGSRRQIKISRKFKKCLDVEGTAMLASGEVLNVSSRKGVYMDVTREATLGLGTRGRSLVPFRSIAINRSRGLKGLKAGDQVYVPQLVGLELPSGNRHDGYLRVDDVGSGVRGIDLYTLTRGNASLITQVFAGRKQHVPLYKVVSAD